MRLSFRKITILKLICLSILLLGVASALAWGARRTASLARGRDLASSILPAQNPPVNPADRIEVELVTLTTRGFWPQEITRPKGKFLLAVETRLEGDQSVTLTLADEKKNRLKEYTGHGSQKGWTNIIDLNPGRYVISVAENPTWTCSFTVTP